MKVTDMQDSMLQQLARRFTPALVLGAWMCAAPAHAGTQDWPKYWAQLPKPSTQRVVLDQAFAEWDKGEIRPPLAARAEEMLRSMLEDKTRTAKDRNALLNQARAWMFLGELVEAQGARVQQAYEDERRGVALFRLLLEKDDLELAWAMSSLAGSLTVLERHPEALQLLTEALTSTQKAGAAVSLDIATIHTRAATMYQYLGQIDKAMPLLQRALAITEAKKGPAHLETGKSLSNLASGYQAKGQYKQALPLMERALAISERAGGRDSRIVAAILTDGGILFRALGQYQRSLALFQRAFDIREKALGPDHANTGTSLNNLALLYDDMGQYEKALPLFERALRVMEQAIGANTSIASSMVGNLGSLHIAMGQYDKGMPLLKQALDIEERSFGPDHPNTAGPLTNLASLLHDKGQYEEALALLQRALKIRESTAGRNHPETRSILGNLALLYEDMGKYEEAQALYQEVLAMVEAFDGPEHPNMVMALSMQATSFRNKGQFDKALPLLEKSLVISERALGAEHPSMATLLNSLGLLYLDMGQRDKAQHLLERALSIREKTVGPEHPNTAAVLNNLALLFKAIGQAETGASYAERALTISEKFNGPEHPITGSMLNNLALCYEDMGLHDKTLNLRWRSLAIIEKTKGLNHPSTALGRANLASLFFAMGQYSDAVYWMKSAIETGAQSGSDPTELAVFQSNLAMFHYRQGNTPQAIYHGKLSLNILQTLRGRYTQMDKSLQQGFLRIHGGLYEVLYGWLIDEGRLGEAEQVLSMLKEDELDEFTRRAKKTDATQIKAPFAGVEVELAKEEAQLAEEGRLVWRKLAPLEERWRQGRAKSADFALPPEAEAERLRLTAAQNQLNERYRAYNAKLSKLLSEQKFDPEELQRLASRSDEYRRILAQLQRSSGQQPVLLQYVMAADKLYILRHDGKRSQALSIAIDSKEVSRQIEALRVALLNPALDPRAPAKALYDWLIAPVQEDLSAQGTQHLMISLAGPLRYIPMAALHNGQRWLVQDYALSMFSETVTDQLKDKPVDWHMAGFGLTHAVPNFAALPAVRDEFAGIGRSGLQTLVSLDEAFTADRVRSTIESGKSPVVHVASHFHLAPSTEAHSFLVLGDGSAMSLTDIGDLAFDGIDLLTLSACETALSNALDTTGKEIESLGAMVQRKGAKAVMASLWKVADQSTALLMQSFYSHRVKGKLSKGQALRQAQLEMIDGGAPQAGAAAEQRALIRTDTTGVKPNTDPALAGYRHPYHWAPFILMGNWL